VFFRVIRKEPADVISADVLAFIESQRGTRAGDDNVGRLRGRDCGMSPRTIRVRLSTIFGVYAYLIARGDAGAMANPAPAGS
jgi:hypothetical protein